MLYFLLIMTVGCCLLAAAEQAGAQPAQPGATATAKGPPPIPSLGAVDTFRRILSLSEAELEKFLATRNPEQRQIVELKLREYQAMPEVAREQRLRELQVRLYVRQMIKVPATNRTDYLKQLRPLEQEMARHRLQQWDALSAEAQQEMLKNEWVIPYIARARLRFSSPEPIENELSRWRGYSAEKKQELLGYFQRFCEELDDQEQSKVLDVFGDKERQQMRVSLQSFERLPKAQRDRCLLGFKRFAELTEDERTQFLVNANHWQNMTPKERQSWRLLVSKMTLLSAPPLPPGAGKAAPPLPPVPSSAGQPASTLVTNE